MKKIRKSKRRKASAGRQELSQALAEAFNTAVNRHQNGHLLQAEELYRKILQADPNHADALHLLGVLAQQAGNNESAVDLIGMALTVNPDAAGYYYNRGVSLQALGRVQEAIDHYRKAVALQPTYAKAYDNLGVALQDIDDYDAAIAAHRKSLQIDNNSLIAHNNLGTLLNKIGDHDGALAHYQKALSCNPVYPEARMKRAVTMLAMGNLDRGWNEYEWRHYAHDFVENNPPRVIPFPKWDGSSLSGKRILVHPEQGIGDEVMFASCVPDLVNSAEHCILLCNPRLVNIFQRSFPATAVIARQKANDLSWLRDLPPIDYRIPAGSLPRFFRPDMGSFPSRPNYLLADLSLQKQWRDKLSELENPINVGIAWRGGAEQRARSARSIALNRWQEILAVENINFINLQYGDHREEIGDFQQQGRNPLVTLDGIDPLNNLDDFAALISALDLVISIDNATVHFAGALGTPAWVLLPCPAEWLWFQQSEDSPWYSSIKLFRQSTPGQDAWAPVLKRILEELNVFTQQRLAGEPGNIRPGNRAISSAVAASHNATASPTSAPVAKALLLNDTSFWYHWGCTCTSLAIHRQLRDMGYAVLSSPVSETNALNKLPSTIEGFDDEACFSHFSAAYPDIIDSIECSDVVIINGEGSLHGLSSTSMGLLYLAYIARTRINRPVHIINHSCYPESNTIIADTPAYSLYRKVYEKMDFIAVREAISVRLLKDMGINANQSFDCLPLFIKQNNIRKQPDKTNNIVIAGSVAWRAEVIQAIGAFIRKMQRDGYNVQLLIGANAYPAADDFRFAEAMHKSFGSHFELVNARSEAEWLDTIGAARLLLSGRFHHSIAAAFLGIPFVALESNTPKIRGVMEMFDLRTSAPAADPALEKTLYHLAGQLLSDPARGLLSEQLRNKLDDLSLQNFSGLT